MIVERAGMLAVALGMCLLPATPAPGAAQQSEHDHTGPAAAYRVGAVRVETAPVLDGVLDDAVWQSAALIDDFVQQEPAEGQPATERTEVRVAYDASNLYLAVRAFDSEPEGVIATEMRRDSERLLEEDNFQVILDTFKDSRSAYMFVTSPLGARLDQQVFEEGEGGRRGGAGNINSNINRDWDGVWHVSAARTSDGWVAEIAIPVVTLRFPDSDVQEWGVNFMRNIRRKNEQVFWAPIPKAYTITRVSLAGTLTEMSSLSRGRDLRIKPALIGGGRRVSETGVVDNTMESEVALDVKYGITPGLNLDVTVNTDFAQAEVDDERVNLTRFALFFPEKREFFLENAGQFSVGTTASLDRMADLFFSRRIGLTADGGRVPILGGARMTGKVGRNNLAIMDIQTDDAFGRPGENFLVARYSRDVFGRSKIGAIVVNKEVTGADSVGGAHFNRTFAADMTLVPHPNLTVNGFLARTATANVSGDQMGSHLRAAWLDDTWRVYSEYTDLDEDFNAEVGFVPRVGIRTYKIHVERNPRPGRFGIRMLEPMHNTTYTTDQSGRLLSRRLHNMLGTRFENGAYLNVFYNHYFERLDDPFRIQGVQIAPGGYSFGEWNFMFRSNPAARVYWSLGYSPQDFYDGERTDMNASLGWRVNSRLSAESGYSRNDVTLPGGEFTLDVGSLRLDYALSPTMTLRTLTQYNSSTDQWSTSARFNWIYRPGSDIYLVYDDVRRDIPGEIEGFSERQLLLKVTYLLSR